MNTILYFQSNTSLARTSSHAKLSGFMGVADKVNWHVQVIEENTTIEHVLALIGFWKPKGIVMERREIAVKMNLSDFGGIPTVFFDCDPKSLPRNAFSVSHDSRKTAQEAARELLMTGYKNFAYVHSPERRFWSDEREAGFCNALALNGKAAAVLPPVKSAAPLAFERELRRFVAKLPKPCALFAANDKVAEAVLSAAASVGVDVPSDLAVVGVDNFTDICEKSRPTLSSVEPDFASGGALAANVLRAVLRSKGRFIGRRKLLFGPLRVVRRASTRILPTQDREVSAALDLIAREACLGLSSANVVSLFSCSRGQAEIRFRRTAGRSILEEIHAVRLEKAKELLRNPNQQIKAICDFCGFRTFNSLCKFFLKKTGMTMSEWRRSVSQIQQR